VELEEAPAILRPPWAVEEVPFESFLASGSMKWVLTHVATSKLDACYGSVRGTVRQEHTQVKPWLHFSATLLE